SDIEALAQRCRFGDCQHQTEPGCAVQTAIENGKLEVRRFNNYQQLLREQAFNGATLAEPRAQSRQSGKLTRNAMSDKRRP
ncbi:GTPase RsgA, partial [Vibrio parahaemolyticus]|nr:GTPase RsgA [Vibrio parahaemolyticus]